MRNATALTAAALLLAALPFSCYVGARVAEREAEPPGLRESHARLLATIRAGLARLRDRYGGGGPDGRWSDVDAEIYRNLTAALDREGESP